MSLCDADIDKMNDMLDKLGVEGFRFTSGILFKSKTILISIPNKDEKMPDVTFGDWISIEDMFMRPYEIIHIVQCFNGVVPKWRSFVNYSSINTPGRIFLKLLCNCSSLNELKLKLQLIGY